MKFILIAYFKTKLKVQEEHLKIVDLLFFSSVSSEGKFRLQSFSYYFLKLVSDYSQFVVCT